MTNKNDNMQSLLSAIQMADSVLLFSHISPDGDTLGSTLALKLLLRRMGKKVEAVLDGEVPNNLRFLPEIEAYLKPEQYLPERLDLAISVDMSCLERLGAALPLFQSAAKTAVIDHHATNEGFGDLNWIDGAAPATAILIYRMYQGLGMEVTHEEAVCLYTALSTDTGNFVYQSVNAESFTMMASLMSAGLPLAEYSRVLFRQKREEFVRLLGKTLPSLKVLGDGKIAGLRISLEEMRQIPISPSQMDGVVDYAIDIQGVRMAYFAHENEHGDVKVSFRAYSPYRVDQVAKGFGGGGHQLAAGCTIKQPLALAVESAERALLDAYDAQKNVG